MIEEDDDALLYLGAVERYISDNGMLAGFYGVMKMGDSMVVAKCEGKPQDAMAAARRESVRLGLAATVWLKEGSGTFSAATVKAEGREAVVVMLHDGPATRVFEADVIREEEQVMVGGWQEVEARLNPMLGGMPEMN